MFKKREINLSVNPFEVKNEHAEFVLGFAVLLLFLTIFCYTIIFLFNLIMNEIIFFIG